jgi:hypothetical protein
MKGELGWTNSMNVMRVYHDLLHKDDAEGLYKQIDTFLKFWISIIIKLYLFIVGTTFWIDNATQTALLAGLVLKSRSNSYRMQHNILV